MSNHNRESTTHSRLGIGFIWASLSVIAAFLLPGRAIAQTVTMNDGGSTATVNLDSSAGMSSWTVNGQNQLNQQWFWYQTDGGVAKPINTISAPTFLTYNGANGINEVTATYQNTQLLLTVDYFLAGGGSGTGNASITESITAKNITGGNLNLNFYQYSSFDLLQAHNDSVQILGGPGAYDFVKQANGATAIQEAVTAPDAMFAEAAPLGQTLNELNTVTNLNLNDVTTAGPGDVTWSLQWDEALAAGAEFDLTKNKSLSIQVTPEPSTIALLALGGGALGLALRRKKA